MKCYIQSLEQQSNSSHYALEYSAGMGKEMKQFLKKRVLALLCVITCMLSMTACADDLAEKMANAGVNTIVGMGIVFVVLIFMVWIISLFKYIPNVQAKFESFEESVGNIFKKKSNKKVEPTTTSVSKPEIVEETVEENLIDDLELVAVITAAIAAMENTSADGLIVRSIKRSANSKWKRS